MKKILIAVDPIHLNQNTMNFGCYLARLTRSGITGVFIENLEADKEAVITNNYEGTFVEYKIDEGSDRFREKMKQVKEKIDYFKSFFDNHCVINYIHEDKGVPVDEIIQETRYADVLIIDAEAGFSSDRKELPGPFARKMLAESECPVIIAPLSFEGIDEIVFAYNGKRSCMFAIKQFADLFPELQNLRVTVLEVHEQGEEPALYNKKFKEWMETRFSNIHYTLLSGSTETELIGYLIEERKAFIVMGAYGRNALSNFFRHSTANTVLKITSQPIFIAHH